MKTAQEILKQQIQGADDFEDTFSADDINIIIIAMRAYASWVLMEASLRVWDIENTERNDTKFRHDIEMRIKALIGELK